MPNGHGGIARFGSSVLLLFILGYFIAYRVATRAVWTEPAAYLAAALFGWRTAWHYYLYAVTEYGGAYTDPDVLRTQRARYRRAVRVWIGASIGLTALFFRYVLP